MSNDYIFRMCINHYIDKSSDTYLSSIVDTTDQKCPVPSSKGWINAGSFYSVDPSIIPIPRTLKLFAVKQRKKSPYDISVVEIILDIFSEIYKDEQTNEYNIEYFTAWTFPVPNTIPLYLHSHNNGIFMSFDKKTPWSPNKDKTNSSSIIIINSPIFVIAGEADLKSIKFHCLDGDILPYSENKNIFTYYPIEKPASISETTTKCNTINHELPLSLEKTIRLLSEDENKSGVSSKNSKNGYNYIIIITVIIILVVASIIIIVKKY